jgi:hypothetical protein
MKLIKNKTANNRHAFFIRTITFVALFIVSFGYFDNAESVTAASNYINPATYNDMQPFLNNKMRQSLQTYGNSPDQSSTFSRAAIGSGNTPISSLSYNHANTRRVISRNYDNTESTNLQQRRVIPRSGTSVARSGAELPQYQTGINYARATAASENTRERRVVMRSGRGDSSITNRETIIGTPVSDTSVSASQCLSDYRSCMDGYCKRTNAPYNRCFCSDALAEIETTLRPEVEEILRKLVIIKNGGVLSADITDAELEQLWQDTFYTYTGSNDMISLNDALNIDWPEETDNMRGKNAFLIGHDYCVQHLRGCFYMISNLRDSYKSEISRDCTTYKKYLTNLKTAGELVISQAEE